MHNDASLLGYSVAHMAITCTACGASNPDSSDWCNQCFSAFAAPEPATPDPQPAAAPPAAAPESPSIDPETMTLPVEVQDGGETGVGPSWTCKTCDSPNSIDTNICSVCGTSIFDAFAPPAREVASVPPGTAMAWALLPGGGHFKTGHGVVGATVAALFLFAVFAGVSFIGQAQIAIGVLCLLIAFGVLAVSIYDAGNLATGGKALFSGRVITIVAGSLVAIIILAVIVQLGDDGT